MKQLVNFSQETIDAIKQSGYKVWTSEDENFYKLPHWYQEVEGKLYVIGFDELPQIIKDIDLKHGSGQKLFTLKEMRDCVANALEWTSDKTKLAPSEYFKQVLGVDLSTSSAEAVVPSAAAD
jgi:hypothetical protein